MLVAAGKSYSEEDKSAVQIGPAKAEPFSAESPSLPRRGEHRSVLYSWMGTITVYLGIL